MSKGYLVIDCGTTNLRVTLLDGQRKAVDAVRADGGVRHTAIDGDNSRLRRTLKGAIDEVLSKNGMTPDDVLRCVAYGMITSNMGLLEIAHVAAPASPGDLRAAMQERTFEDIAPFPMAFIPGVRNFGGAVTMGNYSRMDMMRGEETEAVGLYRLLGLKEPAIFVLPGSHNKFVSMGADGAILGCMTSISGELLDAITHDTILADAVGRSFVTAEGYMPDMACEGAWESAHSGLGRAAFSARILQTLGGRSREAAQSYLLGAVLAQDVQALEAFVPAPDAALTPRSGIPAGFGAALGVAPDMHELAMPPIFVAGKAPVQQAMIDVLDALGLEGAQPVDAGLSARMGVEGAAAIAL